MAVRHAPAAQIFPCVRLLTVSVSGTMILEQDDQPNCEETTILSPERVQETRL